MGVSFKTWEICKQSFLKSSFISLGEFQVNTIFSYFHLLEPIKFRAVSSFKKWPKVKGKCEEFHFVLCDDRMKAHNYMIVPTPDKPAVAQICLKFSTKRHCYQRMFP